MSEQIIKIKIWDSSTGSYKDCLLDLSSKTLAKLKSDNGTEFTLAVRDDGKLFAYSGDTKPEPEPEDEPITGNTVPTPTKNDVCVQKLYINSFFCGGIGNDKNSANYCSHNFVELSNVTNNNIDLSGLSLQYSIGSYDWKSLPLKGVIKAGSTFVIRGAQCGAVDGAKIIVDNYDMEWRNADGDLMEFSNECVKFFLTWGTDPCTYTNPWQIGTTTAVTTVGYIDLVGVSGTRDIDAYEGSPYVATTLKNKLFKKYYALDGTKQATKKNAADRKNTALWNYVDLAKNAGEVIPTNLVYTPMPVSFNKNIFYDKTKLNEYYPSIITCSFGIQATDGGEGKRATRCFNWVSKGISDEYIWFRKKGETVWGDSNESFKDKTGNEVYYNRISKKYTDGSIFTAHKFIKKGLEAGEYEYVAGHPNMDGTPNLVLCTEVRSFVVKSDAEVSANGFKFVQTSDQQGFNWNEYQVWKYAAKFITEENTDLDFMLNTGDMTQNGNRMNEWLDYFSGKSKGMNNLVEMSTEGNNDLSPKVTYILGDGEDASKINLENITFFYTFELDEDNMPVFAIGTDSYYIPSLYSFNYGKTHFLCVNSEIKAIAESTYYGFSTSGNFYPKIKEWCETDIEKYQTNDIKWTIAYCHEMPFTILTTDYTDKTSTKTEREGSNMNVNAPSDKTYWFSEFCQTHNIPLVLGGHKHTQTTSFKLLENVSYNGSERSVSSLRPKIVLPSTGSTEFANEIKYLTGCTESTTLAMFNGELYPKTWLNMNGETAVSILDTFKRITELCKIETEDTINENEIGVVYAMSQATGYKHTSNKELPSTTLPWLKHYYPQKAAGKANDAQKFPFYTIWTVNDNEIIGNVKKVVGIFNGGGAFDINIEGAQVRKGKSAIAGKETENISSQNGLFNGATTEIIKIHK